MQVRFVEVKGVPTRCFIAGREGMYPLLLIHGLTLNAEIWLRNLDSLGRDFYVVAPDLLGSGFSGPVKLDDPRPMIARRVEHLRDLADVLGLETFCACGSSYGGLIAALLSLDNPERIDRLVINGSGSSFNTDAQLVANLTRTLEQMGPEIAAGSLEFWQARARKGFHDPTRAPLEMALSLMTSYAQGWAVAAWRQSVSELIDLEATRPYRILGRLEELKARTLVLWGKQDPGAKYEQAVQAVARMPDARLVAFDDCGHFPMLEHPEHFNQLIAGFAADGRRP
jgi:2-hydroxy-6-oxonona-2,4-dienedioate hydrolase